MNYLNTRTIRCVLAFESALPGTMTQITQGSGLSKTHVMRLIKHFHRKALRVAKWLPHPVHGPAMPVWDIGAEPDAIECLPRLSRQEITRRYEDRIKGTEKHDQRKAVHRSKHWRLKALKAKQGWASALFVGMRVEVVHG
jgi:hypothetical protein